MLRFLWIRLKVLVATLMLATILSGVTALTVWWGTVNPSRYQLAYISQADLSANADIVDLYVHDLRTDVRWSVVEDYLGWGSALAWAPDGRRIAFSAFEEGSVRRNLYVVDLFTRETTRITGGTVITDHNSPSWSPDGTQIVYHAVTPNTNGDIDLYIYDFPTDTHTFLFGHDAKDFTPVWSPDGRTIAFESSPPPHFTGTVFLYDMETGAVGPINDTPNEATNPAWSPDGRTLLYAARNGVWDIYAMGMDGGGVRRVTSLPDAHALEPAWSPDGRMIAYVQFSSGGSDPPRIYIHRADGAGHAMPVTELGMGYRQPAWRP